MKLKDVTKENSFLIKPMENATNTTVKFFDTANKDTRFVYQYSNDVEILSVSCEGNYVPDKIWKYGLKKIMNLDFTDVTVSRSSSGVVYLFKKDVKIH